MKIFTKYIHNIVSNCASIPTQMLEKSSKMGEPPCRNGCTKRQDKTSKKNEDIWFKLKHDTLQQALFCENEVTKCNKSCITLTTVYYLVHDFSC